MQCPFFRLAFVAVVAALTATAATAQTYTWTVPATGGSSNFSGAGWDTTPPSGGNATGALVFNVAPTVSSYILTNDLGNPFNINKLTFNSSAPAGFSVASASGNTLQLTGTGAAVTQVGLGNVTVSSTVTLDTGVNVVYGAGTAAPAYSQGNITHSAVISGAGGLTIGTGATNKPATQNSRVVYLNAANTFAGGVTLDGGTVGGGTTNNGLFGTGGLAVTANGGTWVQTSAVSSLTGGVSIAAGGTLDFVGTSGVQMGSASVLSGAGNLVVRNTSTTALTIQSNSTLSGTVTLDRNVLGNLSGIAGLITVNGLNGALRSVPTFNVQAGGTLSLSSNISGGTNADRIGDAAVVNLRNGVFILTGTNNGAALTETFGGLTSAGYSTVTVGVGTTAGSTTLAGASLGRVERGTYLLRGTNLGTAGSNGFLTFTTDPSADLVGGGGGAGTTTISIFPYAIGGTSTSDTGTTLATYGATGVRALSTSTEFATTLTGGATNNVRLTAAAANSGTATVNALVLASGGQVTGSGTLNVTSGVILNSGSSTTPQISNTVAFGGAEGHIYNPTALTISGNLTGTNGLTKSTAGVLTLSGDNTGLTGTLTVNNGLVAFTALTNLPGTGAIVVNGPSGGSTSSGLRYNGTTPVTLTRNINANTGWLNLNSNTSTTGTFTVSGVISGAAGIYIDTTGDVSLTGANTFTGPIRVNNGNVRFSSDAGLGNGGNFDFGNGSAMGIVLDGNWTTSRHVNTSLTSGTLTFNTQAFTAVLNGPLTNNASLGFGTSSDTIRKAGTGLLQVNAPGNLNYGVAVNAGGGEIRFANDGAILSTTYTVNTSGTLTVDNTALPTGSPGSGVVTTNRVSNTATVTLASGGTFRLTGNGTQGSTELVGQITATGTGNLIEILSSGGVTNALVLNNLVASGGGVTVRGTGLGGSSGSLGRLFLNQFNSAAVTNGQFLANVLAEDLTNPGVVEAAVYDTAVGVRLVNANTDFTNGTAIQNGSPTNLSTTANFRVNPAVANPVPVLDAANTINALRFAPNGVVAYNSGTNSTLTITSGSILTEATGAASVTQPGAGVLTITAGSANLSITTNAGLTVAATLGGTGGLAKNGAGTLTLTGPVNTTGTLTVNAGVLNLNGGLTTAGPVVLGSAATLNLSSPTTVTNLTGAAGGTLNIGANALTLTGTASDVASAIAGPGGSLTYNPSSAASLVLRGANTFTGGVNGNANARYYIYNAAALGTGTLNTAAQTASSSFSTPTFGFDFGANSTTTVANNIVLTGSAITQYFTTPSANANQTIRLTGVLSGGVAGTILWWEETGSTQSNLLIFDNPNNTFTGAVRSNYGTVAFTSDGALGNPANGLTLNSTSPAQGTIRFDAPNVTLAATRTVTVIGTSSVNTNGNNATIAGVLAGTTDLTKIGTGTLTLANGTNTHTGAVTVSAGRLAVTGAVATSTSAVTVASGATLLGTGTIGRPITLNDGSTIQGGVGSAAGTLTTGAITFNGTATLRTVVGAGNAGGLVASTGNFNAGTGSPFLSYLLVNDGTLDLSGNTSYTVVLATFTAGSTLTSSNSGIFPTPVGFTYSSMSLDFSNSSQVSITFTPTPEPGTIFGLAAAVIGVGGLVRRRMRKA